MLRKYAYIFDFGHIIVSVLLAIGAFSLIGLAAIELWNAVTPFASQLLHERFDGVLESVSLLVIAAATLALGQTFLEEEVLRGKLLSAPTRVRHFVSRFMLVIVVALSIEALIAVFRLNRETPQFLPHAASIGIAAAALLVGWGIFIRQNTSAERLEPESIEATRQQEEKIQSGIEEAINLDSEE